MFNSRNSKYRKSAEVIFLLVVIILSTAPMAQGRWITLYTEDFNTGSAEGWELGVGWAVETDDTTYVLSGTDHDFAVPLLEGWSDYSIQADFKLISGNFNINARETAYDSHIRYFLTVGQYQMVLNKQVDTSFTELAVYSHSLILNTWYTLKLKMDGESIGVYLDGVLQFDLIEPGTSVNFGRFSFETLESSHAHIDNIQVEGSTPFAAGDFWTRTGGPSGGLGYDVRIHPVEKRIMYVTDNPSGINRSDDGGLTWYQRNNGITTKTGASTDGVPIFSLTVDPRVADNVWAGTQYAKGIYKSTDGGDNWVLKVNGIAEGNDISFRGFGVHPENSNIVFAGAEITTGILGTEFDKTDGKIYRTDDGGENWTAVWEGGNLARFVLFDYSNPDILYGSTGIFDREAFNDTGVGVIKSVDGGFTWNPINNGIPNSDGNRFVGFLEMHPSDPQTLFAASGCNATGQGGIFKTANGGTNWDKVLSGDIFTVVTISPSHPNIIYAGSQHAFYRSENSGITWDTLSKDGGGYGPPGVVAGFPISAVVDPEDPMTVFANNYMGGNFKSSDGAETWVNSSSGYTGAELHCIVIDPDNPAVVYTIGRSGPFKSESAGDEWEGIRYSPAISPEWYAVAMNPENNQEIFITTEFHGKIFKSTDGGQSWMVAFHHPNVTDTCSLGPQECRHGFKAIAYAPSNPSVVYTGMCKGRRSIDGDFPARPSYGMYKSIDGGANWGAINTGLPTSLLNINCIAVRKDNANIAYIGTWKDGVYKSTDGGANWTAKNSGLTSSDIRSLAIHPHDSNTIYAGLGEGAGIFKTTNGGDLWTAVSTGVPLVCPQHLLPVGRVQNDFSLAEPPKFVTGPDYYPTAWTSIRSLVINPVNPQIIFAADYNSGVYVTFDGGTNWNVFNDSLTMRTVNSLAISNDGDALFAGTFGGGVFRVVTGTNHAPLIVSQTPPGDGLIPIDQSEVVEFSVNAYDLDGDNLTYLWILDSEVLTGQTGNSYTLQSDTLPLSYHSLELFVSDGEKTAGVVWEFDIFVDAEDRQDLSGLPREFELQQNHPNPFNPTTTIEYALPKRSGVEITVYNIAGQKVKTLLEATQPTGYYSLTWDGTDRYGRPVATGIYLYRLQAGDFIQTQKMVLLK
ncbi:MAG: T9SS type A sorting domain-containing protein [FCB group bacterium]|nr:T9SS type A sorting domain-containing protein [FCB group bacterium]